MAWLTWSSASSSCRSADVSFCFSSVSVGESGAVPVIRRHAKAGTTGEAASDAKLRDLGIGTMDVGGRMLPSVFLMYIRRGPDRQHVASVRFHRTVFTHLRRSKPRAQE